MNMFLGTVWSPVGSCPFKKWWRCSQYLEEKLVSWYCLSSWGIFYGWKGWKNDWLVIFWWNYEYMKIIYENTLGTRGFSRMGWGTSSVAWAAKPLAQSALIYHAGWTLICQSNQRSQANSKVITKGRTTRCSTKRHSISRITSLSFNRNHCLKRNLVTVQFSLILFM